ncbi:MAG: hypothetical protein AUJ75_03990 [Candidatus Omnitrophica bacterium CG1_02_49_10]|nr:MAG: hypothetical protein AUJ75_03990 [Candidatus Omnitrophica bacterium CG1_02_49_10]
MDVKERFKRLFKIRFAVMYPFGILAAIFASSDDRSIAAGIGFIIVGLIIRTWSNGYAIKMSKLTTSGPYALMRHPLYLGTILIGAGFVIMLKIHYLGISFLAVMSVIYYRQIKIEDGMLMAEFKDAFMDYKRHVPALIPALRPYRKGEKWPFSIKRLIKSQEYKLFIWVIVVVIAFHLKDEFMSEHEGINGHILLLLAGAFLLGLADGLGELIKWRRRVSRQG